MPGVKGMKRKKSTRGTVRAKAWTSIRIFKRFTIPDLVRTSGGKRENIQRYLKQLHIHKIIAQIGEYKGGRPGSAKHFRLVRDLGPDHPVWCEICEQPLTARECKIREERTEEKRCEEKNNDPS